MRFYLDTSVWGGYYDKEFEEWTVPFIEQIKTGKFTAFISNITLNELQGTPKNICDLVDSISPEFLNFTRLTNEQEKLAEKYIKEAVLTRKFYSDAQHKAIMELILRMDIQLLILEHQKN